MLGDERRKEIWVVSENELGTRDGIQGGKREGKVCEENDPEKNASYVGCPVCSEGLDSSFRL